MSEETEALSDPAAAEEALPELPEALRDQQGLIQAELLLDGRQVSGEIRLSGPARRLVDILNADTGFLTLHSGTLRDASGRCLEFERIQLDRGSIMIAFPAHSSTSRVDPGELIAKNRHLVTVVMPGSQVSGYFHVAPGIDPSLNSGPPGLRFVPITDATTTVIDGDLPTRFEPVALLNTAHAQAYVWSDHPETREQPADEETASVETQAQLAPVDTTPDGQPADSLLT